MSGDQITYIGETTYRGQGKQFGIKAADRLYHVYVIGRTGTGKSTLLETLALQDLRNGSGFALFDPHGDLVEAVRRALPDGREKDLVYLDAPDPQATWTFNPLSGVSPARRSLAAAGMVDAFKKLWSEDWGPRLEHLLRNVVLTLLAVPDSSLGDVPRLVTDRTFRTGLLEHVENPQVLEFWKGEFAGYSPAFRAVVTAPLLNKVGAFLSDPILRRILTGDRSSFRMREITDSGKVLLVNLSKGRMGEEPVSLLGSLLVSTLALAGLSRAEIAERERRPFYVYLDEFQTFGTLSTATMMAELRKYGLGLVLANQYLGQLDRRLQDAVLGNAGSVIAFRVGARDAPLIARELAPRFRPEDLINLPNYEVYLRLMIDGQASGAFSARTLRCSGGIAIGHSDL